MSVYANMALWVVGAIALAVAATYFVRGRVRAAYPGGPRRYLFALIVQSTAFMAPIPLTLALLWGAGLPAGADIALAVIAGMAVLSLMYVLPVTGALLRDLRQTQIAVAMDGRRLP